MKKITGVALIVVVALTACHRPVVDAAPSDYEFCHQSETAMVSWVLTRPDNPRTTFLSPTLRVDYEELRKTLNSHVGWGVVLDKARKDCQVAFPLPTLTVAIGDNQA